MALGGKLPKLTTELDGDLTGLADAFAEGTAMAKAYAQEMDSTLTKGFSESGTHAGQSFRTETEKGISNTFDDIDKHFASAEKSVSAKGRSLGNKFTDEFDKEFTRGARTIGKRGGEGIFGGIADAFESGQRLLIPLLVGAIILASPAIAALISAAVAVGLGLGFAALGTIIAVAMLPKVQKAFATLADPIRATFKYAITGAFDNALLGVPAIIKKYLPGISHALRDVFDAVAPLLRPLTDNLMQGIDALINAFAVSLDQAQPAIQIFISTIPEMFKVIGDFFVEITKDPEALSRFILDAAHAIEEFIAGSGQVISWLTSVYDWAVKLNDQDFEFIGWTRKIEGLKEGWNAFTAWFSAKWSELEVWVKGKAAAVGNWFASIPGAVGRFIGAIPGFFRDALHAAFYELGFFAGKLVQFWLSLPSLAVKAMRGLWSFFSGWFVLIVSTVAGLAGKAVTAVVNWFKSLPSRTAAGWKAFKAAVVSFFSGAPGWLSNAGRDLVVGLVNGAKGAIGWAVDKAKSIAHSITQGFKDALGIKSPSTVFAEIGGNVVAGFVGGVQRSTAMAHGAVQRLVGGPAGGYGSVTPGAGTRAYATAGAPGGGWGSGDIVVQVDGQTIVRASTPAAQRRAARSGPTGLGFRPATGFGT